MENTIKVEPPHCLLPTIAPFIYRTAAAVTALVHVALPGCCAIAGGAL